MAFCERVRQAALAALTLLHIVACGRVGYDLLQPPDAARGPDEPLDEEDGGREPRLDATLPLEDAGQVPDTAVGSVDASEDDASSDAGSLQDASARDGSSLEASIRDASPTEAGAGDAAAAEAGARDAGNDAGVPSGLTLRYDFSGTGTMIQDRIGSAHASAVGGAQLDGAGGLTLDGSNDFVNLPNGLISSRSSVTLMAWFAWSGGPCWQRIFDFGSSDAGEGNVGNATSSLSVTAAACGGNELTAFFEYQSNLTSTNGRALVQGNRTQVTLVVDGAASRMLLYADGTLQSSVVLNNQLSQLSDINAWLGRSQWVQDVYTRGRFDEFRIYSRALSASEIAAANTRGPDAP